MTFSQIKSTHRLVDAAKMFFCTMLVVILLKNAYNNVIWTLVSFNLVQLFTHNQMKGPRYMKALAVLC